MIIHHVGRPIVDLVGIFFDDPDGAGIEVDRALAKGKTKTGVRLCLFVYAVRTEKHEVNADGELGQTDQKMFAKLLKARIFWPRNRDLSIFVLPVASRIFFPEKRLTNSFRMTMEGPSGMSKFLFCRRVCKSQTL